MLMGIQLRSLSKVLHHDNYIVMPIKPIDFYIININAEIVKCIYVIYYSLLDVFLKILSWYLSVLCLRLCKRAIELIFRAALMMIGIVVNLSILKVLAAIIHS